MRNIDSKLVEANFNDMPNGTEFYYDEGTRFVKSDKMHQPSFLFNALRMIDGEPFFFENVIVGVTPFERGHWK